MAQVCFDVELEDGPALTVYGDYYQGSTEPEGDDPSEFEIDNVYNQKTGKAVTLSKAQDKQVRNYFWEDYDLED